MIIDKFLDYFFENCVTAGVSLIKKHGICKSDRQIVEEYANRYFDQKFANLDLIEEFDFQPLQEFISRELDRSIALSFSLPHAFERKRMRDSVYLNAYACSGADSIEKKKIVYQYMDMLFSILENFYLDRTENMILSNHTVDEMRQILNKTQGELTEVLDSIQNKLVQITAKIEYKNSFMEMIDRIKPKTYNNVPFHYLNPSIHFFGREAEMEELDVFREDERQVLFCILTGGGGTGKSRLMFEYAKSREYQLEWKFAFLTAEQGKQMSSFHEFRFDKNLFLIIDYAGSQVDGISDCLYAICQCTKECLPPKLRIVLIERQGVIYDDQGCEQIPYWVEHMFGYGERKIKLEEIAYYFVNKPYGYFKNLCGLSNEILWKIIRDYAGDRSATWEDDVCKHIVDSANEVSKLTGATPLSVLLVEDFLLNVSPMYDMEYQELFDNAVKKWEMSWKQTLCENNSELFHAVELLLIYSTATGRFSLEDTLSSYYQHALDYLMSMETDSVISVISGINGSDQFDGYINPLEPDLIGEYYFMEYIRRRRFQKKELEEILRPLWETMQFDEFLSRCFDDFCFLSRFQFLFEHNAKFLTPDSVIQSDNFFVFLVKMTTKPYNKYLVEAMTTLTRFANENPENEASVLTFFSMFNNIQIIYFDNIDSREVPKIFYLLYQQASRLRDRYLDDENKMMVYCGGVAKLAMRASAEDSDFSLKLIEELVSISKYHEQSCEIAEFALRAVGYYCRYNQGREFLRLLPYVLQVCCKLMNENDELYELIECIFEANGRAVAQLANLEKQAEEVEDICPYIAGEGFIYYLEGEELWVRMDRDDFRNSQFLQTNFGGELAFVQHLSEFFEALECGNIIHAENLIYCMDNGSKRNLDCPFLVYAYGVALFSLSNVQSLPGAAAAIDRLHKEVVRFPQIMDLFCLLGFSLTNQAKKIAAYQKEIGNAEYLSLLDKADEQIKVSGRNP